MQGELFPPGATTPCQPTPPSNCSSPKSSAATTNHRAGGPCRSQRLPARAPAGKFTANVAWLAIAVMTHNLLRAAGALASLIYAKARGATDLRDLIAVAERTARHGRAPRHPAPARRQAQ